MQLTAVNEMVEAARGSGQHDKLREVTQQLVGVRIDGTSGEVAQRKVSNVVHLCQLEVDINTQIDFEGEIGKTHLPIVFSELVDQAYSIAQRGVS